MIMGFVWLNRDKCHIIKSSLPGPISEIEGILSWHQVPLLGPGLGVLRLGCDKRIQLTAKTRQVSQFHHDPEQGHPTPTPKRWKKGELDRIHKDRGLASGDSTRRTARTNPHATPTSGQILTPKKYGRKFVGDCGRQKKKG